MDKNPQKHCPSILSTYPRMWCNLTLHKLSVLKRACVTRTKLGRKYKMIFYGLSTVSACIVCYLTRTYFIVLLFNKRFFLMTHALFKTNQIQYHPLYYTSKHFIKKINIGFITKITKYIIIIVMFYLMQTYYRQIFILFKIMIINPLSLALK
jgi:hypothetical protein